MGNDRTFPLRILQGSWGIAIDLTARVVLGSEPPAGVHAAGRRTWLDVSGAQLSDIDVGHLLAGLSYVATAIERIRSEAAITIKVLSAAYSPTDYQPDGMAAAIVGWVSEEFELDPAPRVDVHFDAQNNRYVVALDPISDETIS